MRHDIRLTRLAFAALFALTAMPSVGWTAARARDLGIPFQGQPGPINAITDVAGVEVGEVTLIHGEGPLVQGHGPARTGVTIIHPLGKDAHEGVAAAIVTINGTGELTGSHLVEELGLFFGPVALTGTGNIGLVHQAIVDWSARPGFASPDEVVMRSLPLVAETLDQPLNDVFGHPLKQADVLEALESAHSGPVPEGNVGGGTGMIAYGFKGGTGTASRLVQVRDQHYRVGVLLQSNHGRRTDLRIAGVPIGEEITDLLPARLPENAPPGEGEGKNSILIVMATDAPLHAQQLHRLARRALAGLGRNGGTVGSLSGEFVLAFSTTFRSGLEGPPHVSTLINDNDEITFNALFAAVVQAVEEAEVNQLVASVTMTGADGWTVYGLPHGRLLASLKRHGQLRPSGRPSPAR
jgi:L-aminopeptidase/D-esterase-like protein